jgi:hypothetical protein
VIQLVVASTLFGAASAAAAVDAGLLGPRDRERVLLVVNNAVAPELTPAVDDIPGAEPVLARFDRVVHLTGLIAPTHPSEWKPGTRELPMLEILLRHYWGLGDGPVEIVCESIWVNPAQSLARVFHAAPVTVYADGLMSYGPTRDPLPLNVVQRIQGLLHLDLVPGLRPVLLSEYDVTPTVIPSDAFRRIIAEIAGPEAGPEASGESVDGRPAAVIVGQYLAALGLVTRAGEAAMHARMVEAAAKAGAEVVRFKPHPSAPPGMLAPIEEAAQRLGVELQVVEDPLPVEAMLARSPHVAIVGCFSTALITARTIFGVRSVAVDVPAMLKRLTPYENSNRVPLTVIDALHRGDSPYEDPTRLQRLVDAVAYCMQPRALRPRREHAVEVLTSTTDAERARYFTASRLGALGLPGAPAQNKVVLAATHTAKRALAHPSLGWLDERTRESELRKRLVKRLRG